MLGFEDDVVGRERVNLDVGVALDGRQDAVGGGERAVADVAYGDVVGRSADYGGQYLGGELEFFHVVAGGVHQRVGAALHFGHFGHFGRDVYREGLTGGYYLDGRCPRLRWRRLRQRTSASNAVPRRSVCRGPALRLWTGGSSLP